MKTLRERLGREQQAELAVALGFCLECGGKLCQNTDGETVCTKCGIVWSREAFDQTVPFPENCNEADYEGHWQPGNTLAFLKGLGDPALANGKGKALMRVIAQSRNGAEDLGVRAKLIKTIIEWEDPKQLRKVLSRISLLLTQMGQRQNWQLANYTGNLARKITVFKLLTKQKVSYRLGDAIIAYAAEKFSLKADTPSSLKVPPEDLQLIRFFDSNVEKSNKKKQGY